VSLSFLFTHLLKLGIGRQRLIVTDQRRSGNIRQAEAGTLEGCGCVNPEHRDTVRGTVLGTTENSIKDNGLRHIADSQIARNPHTTCPVRPTLVVSKRKW